jgi:hypothetical protein
VISKVHVWDIDGIEDLNRNSNLVSAGSITLLVPTKTRLTTQTKLHQIFVGETAVYYWVN